MIEGKAIKRVKGPKFLTVIPKEVRDLLGIEDGDFVEITYRKVTPENEKEVEA